MAISSAPNSGHAVLQDFIPTKRRGFTEIHGWLSSRRFDLVFVLLTAGVGLAAGLTSHLEPSLFYVILFADLWILGYHHVIATFGRLTVESGANGAHRWLVTWLPLAVLGGVIAMASGVGMWTLPTLYLYWQWWHYTRQSYGVAQMYRVKSPQGTDGGWEMKAIIYLVPLTGILFRSYQAPAEFLGSELRVLPVPLFVVVGIGSCAAVAICIWLVKQCRAWMAGEMPLVYNAYMASHVAVFAVGYILIPEIDYGWLAINVWHNSQYLFIVWLFNRKRFKSGVDPKHRWLSTLSQPGKAGMYFAVTFAITVGVYIGLQSVVAAVSTATLTLSLVVFQAINFHHYIVDSVIWKVRKPAVRATLGLEPTPT